uniref:Uncharacterized protein n=1 Tax=Anguilla anguilla TaxID=7936 RepID=A0A0E9PB31_ANGAN
MFSWKLCVCQRQIQMSLHYVCGHLEQVNYLVSPSLKTARPPKPC